MEPMRITVRRIQREREGALVAQIRAVSRERVHGAPRAMIDMRIQLEDPMGRAVRRNLRQRARDEALRFLDVE